MDERSNADGVDLSAILARLGNDAVFAAECAELLEADLPRMLEPLHEGFRVGSADLIRQAAHTLKGALGNFCDGGPTVVAARIEVLARDGRLDDARPLMTELDGELESLATVLSGLRSRPSS
jgi:HPt (histidine-containing phosphotransfer) domain-containing protein